MDRLVIRTYWELGDEIASGDSSVTDEQRAAAGRETLAERSAALLVTNRQRARDRFDAGPGDEEAVRVWFPREPELLRDRLAQDELAVWAQAGVLHVVWRGQADLVRLGGGVQPMLWPVDGADDLWEASLRIRGLDEAVISIVVCPERDGELLHRRIAEACWRGPRAPGPAPAAEPLAGTVEEEVIASSALGGSRGLTVYRPPGHDEELPICILADGQSVAGFAGILEAAVLAGEAPAVLLAGVHSAQDPARGGPDGRAREYIPGFDRARFRAHLRFVTDDVLPHARQRFAVAKEPVLAAGVSNGAAWAIAAAQRRPDIFAGIAALSPGVVPSRISRSSRTEGVRHYLASGVLEPGFRRSTQEWAGRLQRARMPVHHQEWAGGHDHEWWSRHLPIALAWLLADQSSDG